MIVQPQPAVENRRLPIFVRANLQTVTHSHMHTFNYSVDMTYRATQFG